MQSPRKPYGGDFLPLTNLRDLGMLVYLPAMIAIAWIIPERSWPQAVRPFLWLKKLFKRHWLETQQALLTALHGHQSAVDIDALIQAQSVSGHLERLEILRSYRPGGWRPRMELEGEHHIQQALAAGRGAILWVTPMWHGDLVTKMSLHRAGFTVSHLSRDVHGSFSQTRIGVRLLNPIWTRIERRYLAERLVMDAHASAGALRTLVQRIRENHVVSISVGGRGKREYDIPFLRGRMLVAAGAPSLAVRTKAALLPVFTIRREDGSFLTRVETPLSVDPSKKGKEAEKDLCESYGEVATAMAKRHPDKICYAALKLDAQAAAGASASSPISDKAPTANSA